MKYCFVRGSCRSKKTEEEVKKQQHQMFSSCRTISKFLAEFEALT